MILIEGSIDAYANVNIRANECIRRIDERKESIAERRDYLIERRGMGLPENIEAVERSGVSKGGRVGSKEFIKTKSCTACLEHWNE